MSQLERLAEEKKSRAANKRAAKHNGQNANFIAFRPTREEKEQIRSDSSTVLEVLTLLSTWVEDGHKLILGHKPENGAFYLALREGGAPFDQAVTLSVWHTDPVTCLFALKHALVGRYSSFPQVQVDLFVDLEW